jgi:ribosomal protein S18 acetylase RimI-like enzyme
MEIKLRKVKKSDLLQIQKLSKEYAKLMIEVAEETISGLGELEILDMSKFLTAAYFKKNKLYLVAMDGRKVVGFILAKIIYHKEGKRFYSEGKLSEIFITHGYRGKGIAELMWQEVLKWFKENKVEFLQLNVYYGNKKPIAIYKKWGFKPMGLIMKKKLN